MSKRVQISTNIDPALKKRLDGYAERNRQSLRKALEFLLSIGLARAEKAEAIQFDALEKAWDEMEKDV